MSELYLGLLSGTSADGIDAALVDFSQPQPRMVDCLYTPYPSNLREKIMGLIQTGENEIQRVGELDTILGETFADAVLALLKKTATPASQIKAIGSHGQNIRHAPQSPYPFTMQIGNPNIIASRTGIVTVADFRRKDLALGGQGAPLAPAFHHLLFATPSKNRAVVNIGGIANVSILATDSTRAVIGFDSGPGNALMDNWIHLHQQKSHDTNGEFAASGHIQADLLTSLLADPYFKQAAPKSTGREYFNLTWLNHFLDQAKQPFAVADVQATLAELTAQSILTAIHDFLSDGEILVCGGGVHNQYLMSRLQELAAPRFTVHSTQNFNIDPDWIEAMLFAWLAKQRINLQPGNLPSVTGASKSTVLGGIYFP